jgi:ferredoxin
MIVAERKPIEEIKGLLTAHKRILVLGCGTCVSVCLAGGEREVTTLASILRLSNNFDEVKEDTIERQCDAEFFKPIKDTVASCDAILSMACGVGVQMVAKIFEDMPVYPALNPRF